MISLWVDEAWQTAAVNCDIGLSLAGWRLADEVSAGHFKNRFNWIINCGGLPIYFPS